MEHRVLLTQEEAFELSKKLKFLKYYLPDLLPLL
jgi:hypothetical protein